jgi:NAD(P)-dependent dehydrogenase (short-subunit alcohol dehydrogenase family)
MRLTGKVAIITGGGRGIGRAVALAFADEGARVTVAARTTAEVEAVTHQIRTRHGDALAVPCDVADEAQVRAMIRRTLEAFGRIDVLVNNAGISTLRPVWGIPKASFDRTLAVNLVGTFLCTKHAWPILRGAGGGSIINVSSMGGIRGYPMLSAYCASKWGQIGFTLACAEEGKPHRIRVNALAPGRADTAFRAQIKEDKSRMLKAEDHVGICVFLASDESVFVTGQVIALDWFGPEGTPA